MDIERLSYEDLVISDINLADKKPATITSDMYQMFLDTYQPSFTMRREEGNVRMDIYIIKAIGPIFLYSEILSWLRRLGENDIVNLYMGTPGGHVLTAQALMDAIINCKAKTIGRAVGDVASAGTVILPCCDEFVINDDSRFMYHSSSGEQGGKMNKVMDYSCGHLKFIHFMLGEINLKKGFITEDEYERITVNSEDVWIPGSEINARLGLTGED